MGVKALLFGVLCAGALIVTNPDKNSFYRHLQTANADRVPLVARYLLSSSARAAEVLSLIQHHNFYFFSLVTYHPPLVEIGNRLRESFSQFMADLTGRANDNVAISSAADKRIGLLSIGLLNSWFMTTSSTNSGDVMMPSASMKELKILGTAVFVCTALLAANLALI